MKLRCYCCGEPLGERFVLSAMGDDTTEFDRVFLVHPHCAKRLLADAPQMTVRQMPERRTVTRVTDPG